MRAPRWLWSPTLVVTAAAAVLCFVPLFDVLGYELSLAVGLVAAPTSAVIGLGAGKQARDGLAGLGRALALAALHLVPALALATLNAARVKNCDYLEGLAFFALLPLPTAAYGATLGVVVARVLAAARPAVRGLALALVLAAPLVATLWALYREPPIFAFDHLWGHFAGSLYDEVITIDARLIVFRLGTVLRVLLVAAAFWLVRRRAGAATLATYGAAALAVVAAFEGGLGPRLGFRLDRGDIVRALPVTVTRPGLVIHLPASVAPERQRAIGDDHEYRLAQLTAALEVESLPTIHSFVYASAAEKARLMGGRGTMVAKPWSFEIHVHDPVAPHEVVGHELAHVVAATFAPAPLRVSSRAGLLVNMGLVEGLAEAMTPPRGDLDLDAWSRALRELGLAPDVRRLLGPAGFWSNAPRRAYAIAGSFVRFLLREHGPGPLKLAYAHGDFESAYGQSLDELVERWERWIDAMPLSERERAIAAHHFRTPSIFARTCAHEIAALRAEASRAAPAAAVELYRRVCELTGESPGARHELALALARKGDDDEYLALAAELLAGDGLTAAQRAQLLEISGMIDWKRGDTAAARQRFGAVLEMGLGAASQRLQWVRLWALDLPPELGETVRVLTSGESSPLAAVLALAEAQRLRPEDPTLPYLVARQLERAGACPQAIARLVAAGPHPFPAIEAERVRLVAACEHRLGQLARAAATYRRYAAIAPSSGEATRARDLASWLEWRQRRETAASGGAAP